MIIHEVWPHDDPFQTDRHAVLKAVRAELGSKARGYNFRRRQPRHLPLDTHRPGPHA